MNDDRSPWARPETGREGTAGISAYPESSSRQAAAGPVGGAGPIAVSVAEDRPTGYRSGTVTRLEAPPRPVDMISNGSDITDDIARRNRLMLRWFGGGAVAVVVVGLVVLLAMVMTGNAGGGSPFSHKAAPPPDTRPRLAQLCPPPSEDSRGGAQDVPAPPPGPRTVDSRSGISYAAYGAPWQPWDEVWTAGTLHVSYRVGQHFITEHYAGGDYHASILSSAVPVAENDAMVLDLKCTGRQVAADVRAEYYPQPNTIEMMRDEQTVLGGRQAWVTKFRLHFSQSGLQAKDELVGLALIDVGRPSAAILYVSIPGTHRQFDHVVDEVLDSMRPT
jgi:hypothetical protein